ncbi:MAG: hypothetical protein IPM33_10705 [Phycisphaerales bacterium]|nr:hypothetical protein [Phycisphaerales bacterium]
MAMDPEKAEHMVRVEWIKTVPLKDAVKERASSVPELSRETASEELGVYG